MIHLPHALSSFSKLRLSSLIGFGLLLTFTLDSPLQGADPVEFTVGRFAFERPEGWRWVVPTSPMRKAELAIEASETRTKAEVTFFHFGPGQGGGVDSNIARWVSQFSEPIETIAPQIETGTAGSVRITFVRAKGTFQSGMPGGQTTPMTGYALVGAILEDPEGGDVFVKMTGPEAIITASDAAFDIMVKKAGAAGYVGTISHQISPVP